MIEENSRPAKSVPLSEVSHLVSVPLSEVLLYLILCSVFMEACGWEEEQRIQDQKVWVQFWWPVMCRTNTLLFICFIKPQITQQWCVPGRASEWLTLSAYRYLCSMERWDWSIIWSSTSEGNGQLNRDMEGAKHSFFFCPILLSCLVMNIICLNQ